MAPQLRIFAGFGLGALLFAIGGFVAACDADAITFSAQGRPLKAINLDDLARSIELTQITVLSPENGLSVTYEGYALPLVRTGLVML